MQNDSNDSDKKDEEKPGLDKLDEVALYNDPPPPVTLNGSAWSVTERRKTRWPASNTVHPQVADTSLYTV
jgi:hypothetical protein